MVLGKLKYKRVLLKISGEVMGGELGSGIDFDFMRKVIQIIKKLMATKVEVAVVIGGGNYWRYRDFTHSKLDRVHSDYVGMLATVINSVALQDEMRAQGLKVEVMSALSITGMVADFEAIKARALMKSGAVVICAGGTGNPFCSTDMAAALRAGELQCNLLIKATNVDYVYDHDPKKFPKAKPFKAISYDEVLARTLGVMDLAAIATAKEAKVPIAIFNLQKPQNLLEIVKGKQVGTIIHQ